MDKEIKRTIYFGKIDFNGTGRKVNLVDCEIEIRQTERETINFETLEKIPAGAPIISICFDVWDSKKTDCIMCGQCGDELTKYFKYNELFRKICKIWKEYHLNDTQAGTKKQKDFLDTHERETKNYNTACELLKENNLYIDRDYKYGSNWLYKPVPNEVIQDLQNIINKEC